jgi:hypothetical protein
MRARGSSETGIFPPGIPDGCLSVVEVVFKSYLMRLVLASNVLQVLNRYQSAADWTLLFLRDRKLDLDFVAVELGLSLHVPFSIDANQMKSMEAVVDPSQVRTVCKLLLFEHSFILTELFKTDRTPSKKRVVLFAQNLSELLVNVVNHLFFLLAFVAMFCQTCRNLSTQLVQLVIVKSFVFDKLKRRCCFRVLLTSVNQYLPLAQS